MSAESLLSRVLEPEVMDSPEEARDYDSMDHSAVNRLFVDHLLQAALLAGIVLRRPRAIRVLDVGTGTAQIPIELVSRPVACVVVAIDLARHMLELAETNVAAAGRQPLIECRLADAKGLPDADGSFEIVMSNSIIHHIPEPIDSLREMVRVVRPGGLLFVRDLLRPGDAATLKRLVDAYAGDANAHQKQMFADSLHAALTLDEVRELAHDAGLPCESAAQTSDRHWTLAARR